MRNQTNPSESTIIIEPGSYFLKIGRASEPNPKRLAHCIARKIRSKVYCSEPLIFGGQMNKVETASDAALYATLEQVFSVPASTGISPVFSVAQSQLSGADHKVESDAFNFEKAANLSEVFVLEDALEVSGHPDYLFRWPLKHGFLNYSENCSAVIQDLEDIWAAALDKHIGIPRSSIPSYRVILVIGDVFRRNEVRQLVDLLLVRLRFGRVFVHQVGVCATYSVGLPTACVIDLGEEKTTVCCVEDGVSNPESRVTIAVGRANVFRTFHSMVFLQQDHWASFVSSCSLSEVYLPSYDRRTDVQALRDLLTVLNKNTLDLVTQKALSKPADLTDNSMTVTNTVPSVSAELRLPGQPRLNCIVTVPPALLLYCNLLPFACIPLTAHTIDRQSERIQEFQATPLEFSQPDDPFDELYIAMTARERRKRQPGPGNAKTESSTVNADSGPIPVDTERAEMDVPEGTPNVDPPSVPRLKPRKSFESLVDAIWWSINQCTSSGPVNINTATSGTTGTHTSGTELTSNGFQQTHSIISNSVMDELRRRLLGCILLVGAGACGLTGHCLQKWLHAELATRVAQIGLTSSQVEVIGQLDQPDSVWIGARLLLTTDLLSDLWITGCEWKRFGTRALREKAPFLW
ncbi:Actin protein 8 [Fasciola hepatica]|uniref:Actin protein 8 n=1 Tax=Fasciola hepatica TaxID=6192 RepID=A0A4E0R067_FASHE|nr:Actin protein 8 [Fasciola hepatica]